MATQTLEKDLMQLEHRFWDAIRDGDTNAVSKMTDDTTFVAGAQGVAGIDPKKMAELMDTANWELHSYKMEDPHVQTIGKDVALVAYKVTEDITIDGEKLTLVAYDTSVWRRRDGDWVCSMHTESPEGDPFARDKRKTSKAS